MQLSAPIYQLKRRAKVLARNEKIALHAALDRVAQAEGFSAWSHLSARFAEGLPSRTVLSQLTEGDVFLLGARPGHGKTLLGLKILLDAVRDGRRAVFYTLEYSVEEAMERVRFLTSGDAGLGARPEIVTSDEISADFIVRHLAGAPRGSVAVIDYLQILDQQRQKPALAEQMVVLRDFARKAGVILGFISQVDRSFVAEGGAVPGMGDVRLPNPIPQGIFSKACFVHEGDVRFEAVG
ncbi:MAG: DNA helicase [Paracoccaceae bacterium]